MTDNDIDAGLETPKPSIATKKRWLLFVYAPAVTVVSLVIGIIIDYYAGGSRVGDIIGTIALNIVAFVWIRLDSSERDYKLHRLFAYAVVIFGTLALIYYLFRSRGFRGGMISALWLLLYIVLLIIGSMIIGLIIMLILVLVGLLPVEIFN